MVTYAIKLSPNISLDIILPLQYLLSIKGMFFLCIYFLTLTICMQVFCIREKDSMKMLKILFILGAIVVYGETFF